MLPMSSFKRAISYFRKRKQTLIVSAVLFLCLGFFVGGVIFDRYFEFKISWDTPLVERRKDWSGELARAQSSKPFLQLWDIWQDVKENYINQPIDESKILYGAAKGLVSSLGDRFSSFYTPEEARQLKEAEVGAYEGIGAELSVQENRIVIASVFEESPSQKAGLKSGDQILAVDNRPVNGLSLDEVIRLIKGPEGTSVSLLISRAGWVSPKEFKIRREKISQPSVRWEMKSLPQGRGEAMYVRIINFNQDTPYLFAKAAEEILIKKPAGLIVDLRDNPGGYLEAAVSVGAKWLGEETIVQERPVSEKLIKEYRSKEKPWLKNYKTIVLVNHGTASAAEILAGALQDYGAALLVGEPTFGKGLVQGMKDFPDGSRLKLTMAKWYTPKGRSVAEGGIKPDLPVRLTDEDLAAGRDPQMETAMGLVGK